jgi:copper chaperone CopZ
MKFYNLFIIAAMLLGLSSSATAQSPKFTELNFEVSGCCGSCKERIESALDVKGVRVAEWNKETKNLYVVFKTKKITEEEIHALISSAGHDTEKRKAVEEVYENLENCCKYRGKDSCTH